MNIKVIIFGATGTTGLCCLNAALDLGYTVSVFVRNPSLIPSELKEKISVHEGDVLDHSAVEKAVVGHQHVVIALGTRNELGVTTVLSEGTKNIVSAMNKHSIKKVSACLSGFLFMEESRVPERFNNLNAEHKRMLNILKESDLQWVAVLPPHIADSPAKGNYIVEEGKNGPLRVVSKHDLGHFLVTSLSNDKYFGKCCGISDNPTE